STSRGFSKNGYPAVQQMLSVPQKMREQNFEFHALDLSQVMFLLFGERTIRRLLTCFDKSKGIPFAVRHQTVLKPPLRRRRGQLTGTLRPLRESPMPSPSSKQVTGIAIIRFAAVHDRMYIRAVVSFNTLREGMGGI